MVNIFGKTQAKQLPESKVKVSAYKFAKILQDQQSDNGGEQNQTDTSFFGVFKKLWNFSKKIEVQEQKNEPLQVPNLFAHKRSSAATVGTIGSNNFNTSTLNLGSVDPN